MAFKFLCLVAIALLGCVSAEDPEKLVSGSNARNHEFPYIVSIRRNGVHHCGGAIISNRHILTAAHCIVPIGNDPTIHVTVVTGSNYLSRGGQSHNVEIMYYHPQFLQAQAQTGVNWYYDIGIIKLAGPIQFNAHQNKIKLASQPPPINQHAVVAGWGTRTEKSPLSDNLLKVSLKLVPYDNCQQYFNIPISQIMICTLKQVNVGTCQGDSGGPLVYNNQLIGIVSGGIPCAKGYPDIFTNVYQFANEVREWMKH